MQYIKTIVLLLLFLVLGCDGPYFKIPKEPDTSPPLLTITNPADQSTVSDTILITVYAFDNDEIELVELFLNDESVLSQNEGPYEYPWITTEYTEDQHHTIQARAMDISENYNQTNKIQVLVDNVPNPDLVSPTGTILYPANGQTVTDTVQWVVAAADNDGVASVTFYINGDSITTDAELPYEFTWLTYSVADQAYALSTTILDISGNSTVLGPISVIVDNIPAPDTTPPTGNITYPPSSASVSGTVTIKVSAYDDTAVDQVQFSIDGTEKLAVNAEPYEYNWDTTIETDQTDHLISVTITDQAGNVAVLSTISVFVNNTGDGTGPSVTITSPASHQTVSGEVEITASAYDESGVIRVEFYQNGSLAGTDTEAPYAHRWDTNGESDDTDYTWAAKAFDTGENSTQSQSIILHVDNDDNVPPSGFILFPYAGQHLSGEVEIQVSAADNQGVASVDFAIFAINGNDTLESSAASEPYSFVWNTTAAAEDTQHIIQVTITDLSGNTAELTPIAVFVDNDLTDTTPPVVSILSPVSGQIVSDSVTVSAYASDNVSVMEVKFFIDNALVLTATESPYSYLWGTQALADSSEHIIRVSALDPAGNETNAQPIIVTVQNGN